MLCIDREGSLMPGIWNLGKGMSLDQDIKFISRLPIVY